MAVISGVRTWQTEVIIVGAAGDGAAVAAKFNEVTFPNISDGAATATDASGTVTVTWAQTASAPRMADDSVRDAVQAILAADLTLTAPITISARTKAVLAA